MKLGGYGVLDKKTKVKFGTSTHRSEGLFDCDHASIWGPVKAASLGSHRYFVSFIDNLSRHCWIYPIKKFEALGMLVRWKNMMEKQTGRKIKVLQIDRVEEYKDNSFNLAKTLVLIFTSQIEYMRWLRR